MPVTIGRLSFELPLPAVVLPSLSQTQQGCGDRSVNRIDASSLLVTNPRTISEASWSDWQFDLRRLGRRFWRTLVSRQSVERREVEVMVNDDQDWHGFDWDFASLGATRRPPG